MSKNQVPMARLIYAMAFAVAEASDGQYKWCPQVRARKAVDLYRSKVRVNDVPPEFADPEEP